MQADEPVAAGAPPIAAAEGVDAGADAPGVDAPDAVAETTPPDAASGDETEAAAAASAADEPATAGAAPVATEEADAGLDAPDADAETAAADAASGDEATTAAAAADEDAMPDHSLTRDFLLDPSGWPIWPAVAMLRRIMRRTPSANRLVYRSKPSLSFSTTEVVDVGVDDDSFSLVLASPGLAAPGSALPLSDVARIVNDMDRPGGGAISYWMDGLVDRLMQAVEVAESRTNAAFALATGGRLEVLDNVLEIAGHSAPLRTGADGVLREQSSAGAPVPGLARMFIGEATAAGLQSLVAGYTELDVVVEEFVPVDMSVARPQRIGAAMDRSPIGREGEVAAGVNVILDGTAAAEAAQWVREPDRAAALSLLCASYVGAAAPRIFLFVDLAPEHIPPAALDGGTAFGRAALLGSADDVVRVPLELGDAPRAGAPVGGVRSE
ncbi:MAG: type VI secretion system baseplate subunit TssG [Gammaproteobacteria bacterium]|nr:type VI secretion system baseplate subunit TssG [Gammaproteobacteria bacterium]MYB38124.1 type VI secretion system baseplate subunit TssG [Gammaproteobacteria bacterium]